VSSLAELDVLLAQLDHDEPFPRLELGKPRGRQGSPRSVVLPEGWLRDRETPRAAVVEDVASGSGG